LWSKRHGIVAGLSASGVLGAKWIDPSEPAQLGWLIVRVTRDLLRYRRAASRE
jgi:hypothetical protein